MKSNLAPVTIPWPTFGWSGRDLVMGRRVMALPVVSRKCQLNQVKTELLDGVRNRVKRVVF
jgi:hypothetical protein